MIIKNKLIFYFFIILIVLSIIDYITALFVVGAEANVLYLLTKSMLVVFAVKLFVLVGLGFFIVRNVYTTPFVYYLTIMILLLGIGALAIAVYGNVYALLHPSVLAASSNLTVMEKTAGYAWYMLIVYLVPLGLSLLAFQLYDTSVKNVEFKRKKNAERKTD